MERSSRLAGVALFFFLAAPEGTASDQVWPNPATSADVIRYELQRVCGAKASPPVIAGGQITIEVRYEPCALTVMVTLNLTIGQLPAGNYSLTVKDFHSADPMLTFDAFTVFPGSATYGRLLAAGHAVGEPVIQIDPVTGLVQSVSKSAASNPPSASAFDAESRRLYFSGGHLAITDLNAPASPSQSANTVAYRFMEFDPASDSIVGVITAPAIAVARSDEASLIETIDLPGITAPSSFGALDSAGRRLFFIAGDDAHSPQLVTVNLEQRSVTTIPIAVASYLMLEYDPVIDRLLSVTASPGSPVVFIHPERGTVHAVVNSGLEGVLSSVSAFDPLQGRLFFAAAVSAFSQQVVTFDVARRTLRSVTVPTATMAFLEFDPSTGPVPSHVPREAVGERRRAARSRR